jgi:hypothetical protein
VAAGAGIGILCAKPPIGCIKCKKLLSKRNKTVMIAPFITEEQELD